MVGLERAAFAVSILVAAGALPNRAFADEVAPAKGITLAEAYRKARVFNEDVLIQKQNELGARETYTSAWSALGPKAYLTATGLAQTEKSYLFPGDTSPTELYPQFLFTGGGLVTQPVFRRGFFAARDAGRAGIDAAQSLEVHAEEQLMIDVATAYLGVMGSRERLKLAQDAVTRAETQLAVSQARLKAGGALKTAAQLAEVEVDRAKLLVARAEGEIRLREVAYERLVGELPPEAMTLPEAGTVPAAAECIAHVDQRSDARALRQLEDQSHHLEDAARGELWPSVDAQASYTYYSFLYPFGAIGLWKAGVVLTIPLFQSGAEYVKIQQQKIQTRTIELELSRQARVIRSEVSTAASGLETAQKAEQIANDQVTVAREHYDLISAQFKIGAATILDVANAQAVLIDAEREESVARYERELARFQLKYACGALRL